MNISTAFWDKSIWTNQFYKNVRKKCMDFGSSSKRIWKANLRITGKIDINVDYNALYPYQPQNTFNWNLIFLLGIQFNVPGIPVVVGWISKKTYLYIPRNWERKLIWEKGLCRCNWGKDFEMRAYWIREDPKSNE